MTNKPSKCDRLKKKIKLNVKKKKKSIKFFKSVSLN